VVVAALATAVGALPLVIGFSQAQVPTGALYGAGWPAFGLAAAMLLDRGLEPRIGRTLAARRARDIASLRGGAFRRTK
jgi:hypothetical protein